MRKRKKEETMGSRVSARMGFDLRMVLENVTEFEFMNS